MLGCKMEATPFLETSGGSGYTRLDKINVAKAVEYISSAVLVHFLLTGLCNMLTRAFLAGGYARDKSNLEVLMVALTNFLMRAFFSQADFMMEHSCRFSLQCCSLNTQVCCSLWVLSSLIMIGRVPLDRYGQAC